MSSKLDVLCGVAMEGYTSVSCLPGDPVAVTTGTVSQVALSSFGCRTRDGAETPAIDHAALNPFGERVGTGASLLPCPIKPVKCDPYALPNEMLQKLINRVEGRRRSKDSPWNNEGDIYLLKLLAQNHEASWPELAVVYNEAHPRKDGQVFTATQIQQHFNDLRKTLFTTYNPSTPSPDLMNRIERIERPPDSPWTTEIDQLIIQLGAEHPDHCWPTLMDHFENYKKPDGTKFTAKEIGKRHFDLIKNYSKDGPSNKRFKLTPQEIQEIIDRFKLENRPRRVNLPWTVTADIELFTLKKEDPDKFGAELISKFRSTKKDKTKFTADDLNARFYRVGKRFQQEKNLFIEKALFGTRSCARRASLIRLSPLTPQQVKELISLLPAFKRPCTSPWKLEIDRLIIEERTNKPHLSWEQLLPSFQKFRRPDKTCFTAKQLDNRYRELHEWYLMQLVREKLPEGSVQTAPAPTTTSSSSGSGSSGSGSSGSGSSGSGSSGSSSCGISSSGSSSSDNRSHISGYQQVMEIIDLLSTLTRLPDSLWTEEMDKLLIQRRGHNLSWENIAREFTKYKKTDGTPFTADDLTQRYEKLYEWYSTKKRSETISVDTGTVRAFTTNSSGSSSLTKVSYKLTDQQFEELLDLLVPSKRICKLPWNIEKEKCLIRLKAKKSTSSWDELAFSFKNHHTKQDGTPFIGRELKNQYYALCRWYSKLKLKRTSLPKKGIEGASTTNSFGSGLSSSSSGSSKTLKRKYIHGRVMRPPSGSTTTAGEVPSTDDGQEGLKKSRTERALS